MDEFYEKAVTEDPETVAKLKALMRGGPQGEQFRNQRPLDSYDGIADQIFDALERNDAFGCVRALNLLRLADVDNGKQPELYKEFRRVAERLAVIAEYMHEHARQGSPLDNPKALNQAVIACNILGSIMHFADVRKRVQNSELIDHVTKLVLLEDLPYDALETVLQLYSSCLLMARSRVYDHVFKTYRGIVRRCRYINTQLNGSFAAECAGRIIAFADPHVRKMLNKSFQKPMECRGMLKTLCSNDACLKNERPDAKFRRCANCRIARYCGTDCQAAHWRAGHKKTCKEMAKKA